MRGDARALEGIPTSLKDEDAIAGRGDGGLSPHERQPATAAGAVRHARPAHISFPELGCMPLDGTPILIEGGPDVLPAIILSEPCILLVESAFPWFSSYANQDRIIRMALRHSTKKT